MTVDGFKCGVYLHYKGDYYTAIGLATHHHTRLPMVIYVSHKKGCMNVRPLNGWEGDPDGWMDEIELDGELVPRFRLVYENSAELEAKQVESAPPAES